MSVSAEFPRRDLARRLSGALALSGCLLLSGCYVKVHGGQTSTRGHTATTVGGKVTGKANFRGGRASLSSGRTAPKTHGAHVHLGTGAAVVVIVGLMIADAVHYVHSRWVGPRPAPPQGEAILETCSCYRDAASAAGGHGEEPPTPREFPGASQ